MKVLHVVLTSFFFILFVFFIAAFISHQQHERIAKATGLSNHSANIINCSNEFQRTFISLESLLRTKLLLNDQSVLDSVQAKLKKAGNLLTQITFTIDADSDQQNVLEEIKNRWSFWRNEFAEPLIRAKKYALSSDSANVIFDEMHRSAFSDRTMAAVYANLQSKFADLVSSELAYHNSGGTGNSDSEEDASMILLPWIVAFVIGISISILVSYYLSTRLRQVAKSIAAFTLGNHQVSTDEFEANEFGTIMQELQYVGQALESNTATLKRQMNEVDQIVMMLAHEMKIPLRGISSALLWVENDRATRLNGDVTRYLALVRKQMNRINELLEDLVTSVRGGASGMEKEYVHVGALLDDIMEHTVDRRPGVSLIKSSDLPLFRTDRIALRQVLANLVANAFEHHDKENGVVRVYHKSKGEFYEFFVTDDGPGVPHVYRDKLSGTSRTPLSSQASSGIGLAIVKKMLNDRNLEIHLSSEPGKGSTFSFMWPK